MADRAGIVIAALEGHYATILVDRKGACGGCKWNAADCRSCLVGAKVESRAANPVGASAGDLVNVQLANGNLSAGAAILYLLPVVALMLGAFGGTWATAAHNFSELPGALGGAVIGLTIGFLAVVALDRNANIRQRLMPRITRGMASDVGIPTIRLGEAIQ